jgi:hypothetical protein
MSHYHAVVWVDHRSAHVQHLGRDEVEKLVVHAHGPAHLMQKARHIHHRAGSISGSHAPENPIFFNEILAALGEARAWLVVGPGSAKQEFLRHLESRHPELRKRVVGVEPANHPTDAEIADHARRYFKATDRMRPQIEK